VVGSDKAHQGALCAWRRGGDVREHCPSPNNRAAIVVELRSGRHVATRSARALSGPTTGAGPANER